MNHINDCIVTPAKIQKASFKNARGVQRLAAFVCSASVDPWRVFEACQQQRVGGFTTRSEAETANRYVVDRGQRVAELKRLIAERDVAN